MARRQAGAITATFNSDELQKQLKALGKSLSRPEKRSLHLKLGRVYQDAAKQIGTLARVNAQASHVGKRVTKAIFTFADPDKGPYPERGPSALVGVRKGAPPYTIPDIWLTWSPARAKSNTLHQNKRFLVMPGARDDMGGAIEIGMSLSTMMESGTSKMRGRRFFGSAFEHGQDMVIGQITRGLSDVMDEAIRG